MKHSFMRLVCALGLLAAAIVVPLHPATAQPVVFSIETSTGSDTLWLGGPGSIIFKVDPQGASIAALAFPLVFHFSNGNLIGPVTYGTNFFMTDPPSWIEPPFPAYGEATDPDTLLWGNLDFGGGGLEQAGENARITFTPLDTGTISIDTILIPPASHLSALDANASDLPIEWHARTITVAPCPVLMGDITQDGKLTTADAIFLVGYIFKGGPEPQPFWQIVDVDCSGTVVIADVLHIINLIFKAQPMPCVCNTP